SADERTVLLRDDALDASAPNDSSSNRQRSIQLKTQLGAILFVCVLYFYEYMSMAPETGIREDIICKTYYDELEHRALAATAASSIERDCTANEIQRELSLVNQVYLTLHQLPGFLALPYGIAADRIGRKKVLLMSTIGMLLCEAFRLLVNWQSGRIPLRVIWAAPLFRILGGGDAVAATMVLTALSDVYPEENRTVLFARVASVAIVCEIFAPLLGSALMLKSPWLPILLGFAMFLAGTIATLLMMPETLPERPNPVDQTDTRTTTKSGFWNPGVLRQQVASMMTVFWQSTTRLFGIKNVGPLMFSFFATTVGTIAGIFELQYLRKRFGWSYPYATSILTIRPSVTLAVLLLIIPLLTKVLLSRFGVTTSRKDLLLLRVSAALMTIGTLLLCISNGTVLVVISLVVFALGNGFVTVGKSLLMTLGPAEIAGTLFSAMNLSASVGAVVAGPLIAVAFDWGLKQGGFWLGAPLLLVALLYWLTLVSVCAIRVPEKGQQADNEDEGLGVAWMNTSLRSGHYCAKTVERDFMRLIKWLGSRTSNAKPERVTIHTRGAP
ncbi:mfs multidrug protein, partial [Apiospora marii]|uniref:mfs multidrug protein n=1 Tax=Apiospora marii TaxID=335849 RepID=UPI00312D19E7